MRHKREAVGTASFNMYRKFSEGFLEQKRRELPWTVYKK